MRESTMNSPRLRLLALSAVLAAGLALDARPARAHCDRLDGPVATAARKALEAGDFDRIRIWVLPEQEAELRDVFDRSQQVRELGPEARHLADRHFMETAVRLHREAEGMPYTGLKPAGQELPADLEAAEEALETGNVEHLLSLLKERVERHATRWFRQAREARAAREEGVEAGRAWVDAYVQYIVYVHGLYEKIKSPPAHGVGAEH